MRYLLIYDISHDGARTKVADVCLDYGLERIQYSAFLGELSSPYQRELLVKVRKRLGEHGANIQLFPLDEKAWQRRKVIEQDEKIDKDNRDDKDDKDDKRDDGTHD